MKRYGDYLLGSISSSASGSLGDADPLQKRARAVLSSPMAFDREFPQKDLKDMSWVAALPKPFTMALNHFKSVVNGEFNQDIKGLLGSPPPGGVQPQHVKDLENLRKQFWIPFEALLKDKDPDAVDTETGKEAGPVGLGVAEPGKDSVSKFRVDCEARAAEVLSQLLVVVPQTSPAADALVASLKAQSLLQTSERFMAFYDTKNGGVAKLFTGQNKWQRVPTVDETHFREFAKAVDQLLLGQERTLHAFVITMAFGCECKERPRQSQQERILGDNFCFSSWLAAKASGRTRCGMDYVWKGEDKRSCDRQRMHISGLESEGVCVAL